MLLNKPLEGVLSPAAKLIFFIFAATKQTIAFSLKSLVLNRPEVHSLLNRTVINNLSAISSDTYERLWKIWSPWILYTQSNPDALNPRLPATPLRHMGGGGNPYSSTPISPFLSSHCPIPPSLSSLFISIFLLLSPFTSPFFSNCNCATILQFDNTSCLSLIPS